ncbi:sulfurtransferase [Aeromicrobium ginsengisoli]|uniref:Sulfurtransferase n=1 Tax=Aeromicrobium ginsengisoli TaxID=363867 RepID=A0A5M4FAB5_9ACTN|nr:sulfurtransferase [Aeromicrobium ginsengisoli]KAA1395336.1 sulfurtransferase [Aeromicrobium ginsengisoli]
MSILIQAPELISSTGRIVLLDVRWKLGGPPGRDDYLAGHLPGAVFVGLDTELAAHGEPQDGRHPLPSVESLQAAARRWGIGDGDAVVAYDDSGNLAAARAWWLLRWAGFDDVRLLDGGLSAWVASGGALETDDVVPEPGDVTLDGGHLPTIDIDGAASYAGVLLDARAGERYTGETEPIDPQAGHIPGAVSAPTTDNLDDTGHFRTVTELRRRFEALGVRDGVDVAAYCGSGVTAAHEVAALAIAGFDAALYPGSWSQWSNHDDRPVATGTTPR